MKGGIIETTKASFGIAKKTIERHGFLELFKGVHIMSFKRCMDWLTRYFFVECIHSIANYFYGNNFESFLRKDPMSTLIVGMLYTLLQNNPKLGCLF